MRFTRMSVLLLPLFLNAIAMADPPPAGSGKPVARGKPAVNNGATFYPLELEGREDVRKLGFTLDGKFLIVAAGKSRVIRLIDVENFTQVREARLGQAISDFAVTPGGLVVVFQRGPLDQVWVLDSETLMVKHRIDVPLPPQGMDSHDAGHIASSPNSDVILVTGGFESGAQRVQIIDVAEGKRIRTLEGNEFYAAAWRSNPRFHEVDERGQTVYSFTPIFNRLTMSPDARTVVCTHSNRCRLRLEKTTLLFDDLTPRDWSRGAPGNVTGVVFSPDSKYFFADGRVYRTIDLLNPFLDFKPGDAPRLRTVDLLAFDPERRRMLAAWHMQKGIAVLDATGTMQRHCWIGQMGDTRKWAVHPDLKRAILLTSERFYWVELDNPGAEPPVLPQDALARAVPGHWLIPDKPLPAPPKEPDVTEMDAVIDVEITGKHLAPPVFAGDGKHVYFLQQKGPLQKLELPTFREVARLDFKLAFQERIHEVGQSAEGLVLTTIGGDEIQVIDEDTLKVKRKIPFKEAGHVTVSPALSWGIATKTVHEDAMIVDLRHGKLLGQVRIFESPDSLRVRREIKNPIKWNLAKSWLSPDGKWLLTPWEYHLVRMKVEGYTLKVDQLCRIDSRLDHTRPFDMGQIVISPNFRRVLIRSERGRSSVYSIEDIQKPIALLPHSNARVLAMSDDGARYFGMFPTGDQMVEWNGKGERVLQHENVPLGNMGGTWGNYVVLAPDGRSLLAVSQRIQIDDVTHVIFRNPPKSPATAPDSP